MSINSSASPHPNFSRSDLEAINDQRALTLVPAMVVLVVLGVVGVVGNSLVVYVFCCRLKSGTQNFLIVCLAVLDLLSCLVAIPNEVADMRFYFVFQSAAACRIMRFINTFCAIGSIFTLLVIAIDRYRKICKPFHGQLHLVHVRLSLIPIFGGALFFGWPAFLMYGLRTTETGVPGLLGQDCSTPDKIGSTIYPLLYNVVLLTCFLVLAFTLLVLYALVLKETKRHNRYLKRNSDFNIPSSGQYNSEESHSIEEVNPAHHEITQSTFPESDKDSTRIPGSRHGSNATVDTLPDMPTNSQQPTLLSVSRLAHANSKNVSPQNVVTTASQNYQTTSVSFHESTKTIVSFIEPSPEPSFNNVEASNSTTSVLKRPSLVECSGPSQKDVRVVLFDPGVTHKRHTSAKVRRFFRSKTTMIAFLVTLVFILSFLPHLSLQITKLMVKGFDYHLQDSALVAYNIFLRSYFINSVSNPFIYGALNAYFSKEVKGLLARLHRKS